MNDLFYEEYLPYDVDEEDQTVLNHHDVFLSDLCGHNIRNIAIISKRTYEQKSRKYLKIVGLDIFTGKIVSLIDNHGKSYGLCSYSEDCAKLKPRMVIKVPVELCENVFIKSHKNQNIKLSNALRITGKYEVLGKTNWFALKEKLYYLCKNELFKLFFEPINAVKIFELFKNHEDTVIYIPVQFPGTHYIKAEGSKLSLYNPETGKSFDFISATNKLLDNVNKYLDGIVVAKITVTNGKITVLIDKPLICQYFRYSKSERNNDTINKLQQDYKEQQELLEDQRYYEEHYYEELYSLAAEEYDRVMFNSGYYPGPEDDYSDKYRPYESMEEYCDEYEESYEFEMSNDNCFWGEEY